MTLKEIIKELSKKDRTALATRYKVQIEELEKHLGQPEIIKNEYSVLSRRLRQHVNFLFQAGGVSEFEEFRKKYAPTKQDLKILYERALIFSLPDIDSPQKVVLPLEHLFILNVPGKNPLSMISALRNLQSETLELIAAFNVINCCLLAKPFCAAQIYQHFIENIDTIVNGLIPDEKEILQFVVQHNGNVSAANFFQKYSLYDPAKISYWDINIHDLYQVKSGRKPSAMQKLFLKGLLVPISQESRHTIQTIAIPAETYDIIAKEYIQQRDTEKRVLAEKMQADVPDTDVVSNESQFIKDIKVILLIVENLNPRVTQSGALYKKDIQKICHDFKLAEEYVTFIFNYLSFIELIKTENDRFEVTIAARDFLRLSLKDIHLLSKHYFLNEAFYENESSEFNIGDVVKLILNILRQFNGNFSNTALYLQYARHSGSFLQLTEAFAMKEQRFRKICDEIFKKLYWLGLLELRSDFKFIRLGPAGQYVFHGKIKTFQNSETEEENFTVLSSNEIVAPFNTRFDILLQLASFSTINSMDVTINFLITKSTLIQAYYKGRTIQEINEFLKQYSKTPLPQTLLYLFQELEKKEGEVELIPASGYIKIRNPYILEEIKVNFRQLILEAVGEDQLILRAGINLLHLENQLKQKDYFLKSGIVAGKASHLPSTQLKDLLDSIEPPQFNSEDLNFPNPAHNQDDIKNLLRFAIDNQIEVTIEYHSDMATPAARKINPLKLHSNLIEAYCYSREATRAFRIDRIRWAELLK